MIPIDSPTHITVCIPTYKRPSMLGRCLEFLQVQKSRGFSYSLVVVDNDIEESARGTVTAWKERFPVGLVYDVEPERNISLARNRAVANSRGDFIAFIDDDEFPEPDWLLTLFQAFQEYDVDGVMGPVLPFYEGTPPAWLVRSGLCVREPFPTGTRLRDPRYMRTGNALLSRLLFSGGKALFDPRFGRSGGEDADFFGRMVRGGSSFVWCNEARVYETVPPERQNLGYFMKRALIRGVTSADDEALISLGTMKSVAAVMIYTAGLPFLMAAGRHLFVRYLIKDLDHISKLLARCGIKLVRERLF